MELSDPKRLRELEFENPKLKRIVTDQVLDMSAMKKLLQKHWSARGEAQSRRLSDEHTGLGRTAELPDRRTFVLGGAVTQEVVRSILTVPKWVENGAAEGAFQRLEQACNAEGPKLTLGYD